MSVFVLGVCVVLVGYGLFLWVGATLPDVFSFEDYRNVALQVTRIYAADGTIIGEFHTERRSVVSLSAMPEHLQEAVLAAEDGDFFEHEGLDYSGIMRALFTDLMEGRYAQGGSTITQQVAKTFYLSAEKTLSRKAREAVLAFKLERALAKDEILALYLNQIYFGHGRYGVQEASRFYFGKDVRDIDVEESALLAGVIRAPERLSPFKNPKRAHERRDHVLQAMADRGVLDQIRLRRALKAPIPRRPAVRKPPEEAAYFVDAVRRELLDELGERAFHPGGLRVYTTLDMAWQVAAEQAVLEGLRRADKRARVLDKIRRLGPEMLGSYLSELEERHAEKKLVSGERIEGVVRGLDEGAGYYVVDLGIGKGVLYFEDVARYATGRIRAEQVLKVGDLVPVTLRRDILPEMALADARLNLNLGPQAALVAMDGSSGAVRALIGGERFEPFPYNRAIQTRRPAGSTFKALIVASGLELGIISPESTFLDERKSYDNGRGGQWRPRNVSGAYSGEEMTVAEAISQSVNTIAVQVLEKVGVSTVVGLCRHLGFDRSLPEDLSLALGSASVSPMQLTAAFAAFASGGMYRKPRLIDRVITSGGHNLWNGRTEERRVFSQDTVHAMHSMLRGVVQDGTGRMARIEGLDVAGKTGTSNGAKDSWFVGFTSGVVSGVWIGYDQFRPLYRGGGGALAAPLWKGFVSRIAKQLQTVQPEKNRDTLVPSASVHVDARVRSGREHH